MKCNKIAVTAVAMITVLLFFFAQGAAIIILKLEDVSAKLIPALILFVLAALGFLILKITKIPLREAGFRTPQKNGLKKLLYLIPLIIVALSGLVGGIDLSKGITYIFACLLYVLAIGFSEELYFRSIICNILAWIISFYLNNRFVGIGVGLADKSFGIAIRYLYPVN